MTDENYTSMVDYKGEPYISLTVLQELLESVNEFISSMVADDPSQENIIPGAAAVLSMLESTFNNVRVQYANSKNLAPEAVQTIKEIYDFLGEQ